MSTEQEDPSAEDLYTKHKRAARALENWTEEDQFATGELGEVKAEQAEVLADTIGSEELDRINSGYYVAEQQARVDEAREGVRKNQVRYDTNIEVAKDKASSFIDEAKAEDVKRSEESQS